MKPLEAGGPAFPSISDSRCGYDEHREPYTAFESIPGMTLRDWFAGQALAGIIGKLSSEKDWNMVGLHCYNAADKMIAAKMIAAREKGGVV